MGGKERLLLAHLVAAGGRLVTVDELSDSMWGERPPRAPGKALQTYVLRLRNALEPDRRGVPTIVVTEGAGYRLAADHEVDALRFTNLAAAGRGALDAGRPAEAAATLREALDLWRGPAYAGFEDTPFGRSERQRLDELHGTRSRTGGPPRSMPAGHGRDPGGRAPVGRTSVAGACLGILVLALCRAGRQGEALGALGRARAQLAEELGVDPGPELQVLQARVLAHDPGLLRLPSPLLAVTEGPRWSHAGGLMPTRGARGCVRKRLRGRRWRRPARWARRPGGRSLRAQAAARRASRRRVPLAWPGVVRRGGPSVVRGT